MTRTTRSVRPLIVTLLGIVAAAVVAVALLRPDPAGAFWADYTDAYPGTPDTARAAFVAKARQLCDAGMPLPWWETWPQSPANVDLWNLSIAHLCPQYAGHVVSVAP